MALDAALRPWPSEYMEAWDVSTLVNAPANDTPECIRPLPGGFMHRGQLDEGFQTKNYRNRTVGLHPDLGKMLFWWKSTSAARVRFHKESRSEYIVTYKGDQIASAERALRSAYKKAGLGSERPFHTLRHSFSSYLAMSGVGLYDIAKLMGHTFEQVTQLYAHLQPEYLHKQVAKIPALALRTRAQNVPTTKVDESKLVEIAKRRKKIWEHKSLSYPTNERRRRDMKPKIPQPLKSEHEELHA